MSTEIVAMPINDKPLNQTQVKNLERLVDGDFTDLRDQVYAEIDRRLETKMNAIATQYGDTTSLESVQDELRRKVRQAEDDLRSWVNGLRSKGVTIRAQKPGYGPQRLFNFSVDEELLVQEGREEAEQRAQAAAVTLKSAAQRVMGRTQRQVMRQVLLQSISSMGALQLVEDLPRTEDIIGQIEEEVSQNYQDAIAELHVAEPKRGRKR